MVDFDYLIVGGGLQGGLLTLAIRHHQPHATIALLERNDGLGGNHTWCIHDNDIPSDTLPWVTPLLAYRWDGHRILFPDVEHVLDEPYSGVSSERLGEVVGKAMANGSGCEIRLGAEAEDVGAECVRLSTGEALRGKAVIDARGGVRPSGRARAGYQKFFGMEVDLVAPHGMELPIIMDARLDQSEGYRFMYVLPTGDRRLLLEDTYFNEDASLDPDRLEHEIRKYAAARDWTISRVVRTEQGILPMPWSERIEPPANGGPLGAGYRGGWYHPGTGYSFPIALRLAEFVAGRGPEVLFGDELRRFAREHRRQAWFPRFLNRLLFRWYPPSNRRYIFERVYRMPAATVRNFYALDLNAKERLRFLTGRPPRGISLRHRLWPTPFVR